MNGRFARAWVAAFIGILAVYGFGQLESWPFTSWYMFSHVEPATARVARAVAIAPSGEERVLRGDVLPEGLLSHRLLARFATGTPEQRANLCSSLLHAARTTGAVVTVRVEELRWNPLERDGERPVTPAVVPVGECR